MTDLLLKNATVVLRDREVVNASVLIENGSISSIGSDINLNPGLESIDLSGATLLPGFIDVHIHGAVGVDVMSATPAALQEVSVFLASQGVTAWLPTLVPGSDEEYENVATSVAQSMRNQAENVPGDLVGNVAGNVAGTEPGTPRSGARILGLHYEGPFVNSAQCGALHVEHFKTYSGPSDLDRLRVTPEMKKMITLAPEVDGAIDLIRELTRRGWIVSLGHTRAPLPILNNAFEAGARHMTHFMNAMSPLHHRNPGPIAWGLSHDDVSVDMIADGIHLDPFMLRLLVKLKGPRSISLISDAIAAAGRGDGDYKIWGETITVKNGRTSNASGSIAGSVITMLDAVKVMHSLGISYVDLAHLASLNPARLLGIDSECGSIEPGKRADLVALDSNSNVLLTLISGRIVS
jgi:N-acetylglucosamine-6-phosphate deacetylase